MSTNKEKLLQSFSDVAYSVLTAESQKMNPVLTFDTEAGIFSIESELMQPHFNSTQKIVGTINDVEHIIEHSEPPENITDQYCMNLVKLLGYNYITEFFNVFDNQESEE